MGRNYKVIPRDVVPDGLYAFDPSYTIIADIPEVNLRNAKIYFLPTEAKSKINKKIEFFKQNIGKEITVSLEESGENSFTVSVR